VAGTQVRSFGQSGAHEIALHRAYREPWQGPGDLRLSGYQYGIVRSNADFATRAEESITPRMRALVDDLPEGELVGLDHARKTYYAVFDPPFSSADNPDTLLRRQPDAPRTDSERLVRDGKWVPSDLVARIYIGSDDSKLIEITHARAVELAKRWRRRRTLATVPPDLAGA
jgi:hypothetical protein